MKKFLWIVLAFLLGSVPVIVFPKTFGTIMSTEDALVSTDTLWVTNAMLAGSIAASKLVGTDIATVGTITTGTWHGTAIVDTYISSATTWNAKEAGLGNPAADNYVLQSTAAGVRSWVSKPASLNAVENTALSTWMGTTNIITLGTITTGTWHGTAIDHGYLSGIAQADVAGLTTASSPVFVTAKLSSLTDSYVPYHISDAIGLSNSPIYTDGTNVNIGGTALTVKLDVAGTIGLTPGNAGAIIRRTVVNGSYGVLVQGNTNDTLNDTYPGAQILVGGGPLTDGYEGNIVLTAYGGSISDPNRNYIDFARRTGVNTTTSSMRITGGGDVRISGIKSTSGVRYVCVDSSGTLTSQATACVGT